MPKVGLPPQHEWTHRSAAYDAIAAALAAAAHPSYSTTLLDIHLHGLLQELQTGVYHKSHYAHYCGSSSKAITANQLYACPFLIARNMTADRIGVEVATLLTGSLRMGIYANGTNLYPGALLLDAGVVDTSTTGLKELTINLALTRGLIWLAFVADAAPNLYRVGRESMFNLLGTATTIITPYATWKVAQTYGALPNPFTAGGAVDADLWLLGLRFASMD